MQTAQNPSYFRDKVFPLSEESSLSSKNHFCDPGQQRASIGGHANTGKWAAVGTFDLKNKTKKKKPKKQKLLKMFPQENCCFSWENIFNANVFIVSRSS